MLPRAPIEPAFEPQVYPEPFGFSFRHPSRSILSRFVARLLVQLLILSAFPGNIQAAAALFPISMLWPLVAPASDETQPDTAALVCGPKTRVWGFEEEIGALVGVEGSQAAESRRGYGLGYGGSASDRCLYAKARYLDPTLGRFTTQDDFLGDIDDPLSLHRYSYAHNRPTYYIDPYGFAGRRPQSVIDERGDLLAIPQEGEYTEVYADPFKQLDYQVSKGEKTSSEAFSAALDYYGEPIEQASVIFAAPIIATAGTMLFAPLAAAMPGVTSVPGTMAISGALTGAFTSGSQGFMSARIQGASLSEALDQARIEALPGAISGGFAGGFGAAAGELAAARGYNPLATQMIVGGLGGGLGDWSAQRTIVGMGLQDRINWRQTVAMTLAGSAMAAIGPRPSSSLSLFGGEPVPRVAPSRGLGQHGVNLLEPAQLQPRPREVRFGPARGGGGQAADVAYAYRVTGGAEKSIYVRGTEFEASNAGVLIDAKNAASRGAPQSMYDIRIKPGARPSAIRFTNDFKIPQLIARAKRQLAAAQGLGFKGIRWPIADAEVARVVDDLFTQRGIPIQIEYVP